MNSCFKCKHFSEKIFSCDLLEKYDWDAETYSKYAFESCTYYKEEQEVEKLGSYEDFIKLG